jgi:hypothetical protein
MIAINIYNEYYSKLCSHLIFVKKLTKSKQKLMFYLTEYHITEGEVLSPFIAVFCVCGCLYFTSCSLWKNQVCIIIFSIPMLASDHIDQ